MCVVREADCLGLRTVRFGAAGLQVILGLFRQQLR
jgi:hypothetical protein